LASLIDDEKKLGDYQFDLWKQTYVSACAAVDDKLRRSRRLDAVQSGCTTEREMCPWAISKYFGD
jgi:hypothetical protein